MFAGVCGNREPEEACGIKRADYCITNGNMGRRGSAALLVDGGIINRSGDLKIPTAL